MPLPLHGSMESRSPSDPTHPPSVDKKVRQLAQFGNCFAGEILFSPSATAGVYLVVKGGDLDCYPLAFFFFFLFLPFADS